jgi:ADP-ribosylglycohydrolase
VEQETEQTTAAAAAAELAALMVRAQTEPALQQQSAVTAELVTREVAELAGYTKSEGMVCREARMLFTAAVVAVEAIMTNSPVQEVFPAAEVAAATLCMRMAEPDR